MNLLKLDRIVCDMIAMIAVALAGISELSCVFMYQAESFDSTAIIFHCIDVVYIITAVVCCIRSSWLKKHGF